MPKYKKGHKVSEAVRRKIGIANSIALIGNRTGQDNNFWKGGEVELICKICKSTFKVKLYRKNTAKYCSFKCRNKAYEVLLLGSNSPNWRGGISFEPYSPTFNQQLKDKVRVRDNFICQLCGVPELECKKRLNIHHIDYNKKNSELNNLISLCHKCHVKTIHHREYWQKYFKQGVLINVL